MTITDGLLFAWNALRGHRLRTVLSTLGVTIGVTSVVLLTALGEGARVYVTSELASLGSSLLIVIPGKLETSGIVPMGGAPNDLTIADAQALQRRIPRIRRISPLILGEADVSYGSFGRHVPVIGANYDFLSIRRLNLHRGSFLPPGELDRGSTVCVIGTTIQQELFAGDNPLGKILRVGDWRFRVIGVLAPKGQTMGFNMDDIVLIPAATAMRLFDQTSLFRLFIEATSHEDLNSIKKQVLEVLIERHDNEEDVTLLTQDSVLASFNNIFRALTLALAGIAAISLTVAGIGIMNVMLVAVSERTSEIGLLKAVGANRPQIIAIFLAEAMLLSVLGGFLGLIAAYLLAGLSRQIFPALPTEIPQWAVFSALGVALTVGITFGVWPARRAAGLDPILALQRR